MSGTSNGDVFSNLLDSKIDKLKEELMAVAHLQSANLEGIMVKLEELTAKLNVVSAAAGQKKAPRKATGGSIAAAITIPNGADPNDPNSEYLAKLLKRSQAPTWLQYMAGSNEGFFKERFDDDFVAKVSGSDAKAIKMLKSGNQLEFRRAVALAYWKSLGDSAKDDIRTQSKGWRNDYITSNVPKGMVEEE